MIKSMTAYAAASLTENRIRVDIEIRSYNSKYLDTALYLPKSCHAFEEEIKKRISRKVDRGRVEVRISLENDAEDAVRFLVNESRASAYHQALKELGRLLAIEEPVGLDQVLQGHDMILPVREETGAEEVWKVLSAALEQALEGLDAMRRAEGDNLIRDFESRLETITAGLSRVRELAGEIPEIYRQRLMERIKALTSGVDVIDPVRIAQEAAFLADKSDISEELVRAESHIKQFRETLGLCDPVGRKLNFLIQEFHREFNTMGSKAGRAELSHVIVDLKSELEKIREQVQNIE